MVSSQALGLGGIMNRAIVFAVFVVSGIITGCTTAPLVCTLEGTTAIRLVIRDGQTAQVIKAPIVTATIVGVPNAAIGIGPTPDSSATIIMGGTGVYDVVIKKDGYSDLAQRVTVDESQTYCKGPQTLDLTLTMSRRP
jgi:hypothetical protein